MSTCYLLHFDRPISPDHTCQHYVGYTARSLAERLAEHAAGRGARLTQVAIERAPRPAVRQDLGGHAA